MPAPLSSRPNVVLVLVEPLMQEAWGMEDLHG